MSWQPSQNPDIERDFAELADVLADPAAPASPAADLEPGSPHELLAEQVESAVRHQFRTATNAQVDAITSDVTKAAIQFAEFWQTAHPRRQVPW
jgi:hypothetical protein